MHDSDGGGGDDISGLTLVSVNAINNQQHSDGCCDYHQRSVQMKGAHFYVSSTKRRSELDMWKFIGNHAASRLLFRSRTGGHEDGGCLNSAV